MLYLYYVSCVALSECVSASVWCPVVLEHVCVWYVLVFYASVLMIICMSCTYLTWGVLVLIAGMSVGDVVSECRLNHYWPVICGPWGFRGHLVGQPLFKYQNDARSNTHKMVLHIEWWQSGPHLCKIYDVLLEWVSEENLATNAKYQI